MSNDDVRLGIMSYREFEQRTIATREVCGMSAIFKSRGNNMARIDTALKVLDAGTSKRLDPDFMSWIIDELMAACYEWLNRKRAGGKNSPLSNYRKNTIEKVLVSARNANTFICNKSKTPQATQVKTLSPGYNYEREHYMELGKKQNPYAASGTPGLKGVNHLAAYKEKASEVSAINVDYFSRERRLDYMVYIDNGLFYTGLTTIHCVKNSDLSLWAYAMDRHGSMFAYDISLIDTHPIFFNHSSFCAGREVVCAGTFACLEGKLKYLSNNSGHYKPSAENLKQCLVLLAQEHVNVEEMCIGVKGEGINFLQGGTFITNTSATPDWPDMQGEFAILKHNGSAFKLNG